MDAASVRRLVRKLDSPGLRLRFCYEAGPTGYGLKRLIEEMGYECAVIAPSLIPRRPGVLDEFYRVAFRKKLYRYVAELQANLDAWIRTYNEEREQQGRWCCGKTPMRTFLDAKPSAKEKMISA